MKYCGLIIIYLVSTNIAYSFGPDNDETAVQVAQPDNFIYQDVIARYPSDAGSRSSSLRLTAQIIDFGLTALRIADQSQPIAQWPITYLLEGQPTNTPGNSSNFIPPGTVFSIALPAGTSFIEAGALSFNWLDFRPLACTEVNSIVECPIPDDEELWFPIAIALQHELPGPIELVVNVAAPEGTAIDGESEIRLSSEVIPDDQKPVVVDILFLHEPAIAAIFPESKLRHEFDSWIAFANSVLRESEVKIILRSVGVSEFSVDPDISVFSAQNAVANSEFYALRRQETGADIGVYYKRKTRNESCGVGPLGLPGVLISDADRSLAIVQESLRNCGAPSVAFLHEIGHVMGLGHNVEVPRGVAPRGYWTFARGHTEVIGQDPGTSADYRQGSIMAANTTNRLSNPDVICPTGFSCGVGLGHPEEAHAALALNALRRAIRDANSSHVDPAQPDVGIFLRGSPSANGAHRVRVELQNYSASEHGSITFELTTPQGWTLSGSGPIDACAAISEAMYGCEVTELSPFGTSHVELDFITNGLFASTLVARLVNPDSFEYNNPALFATVG